MEASHPRVCGYQIAQERFFEVVAHTVSETAQRASSVQGSQSQAFYLASLGAHSVSHRELPNTREKMDLTRQEVLL